MNQASAWRLDLARNIAPAYASNPHVQALFVHGSTARGCADRYSDIELSVIWSASPTPEDLNAAIEKAGGNPGYLASYDEQLQAWPEDYTVAGVKIDVGHWTRETFETILADVVESADSSFTKQTTVSVVQHGIPLYGANLMEQWQQQVAAYPRALGVAMVDQHLHFGPFSSQEMLAERNEVPLLYENACRIERKLLAVLMGLNRIYYPGFKWTHRLTEEMAIAPPELFVRLVHVFRADAISGTSELRNLIEETFALVEMHMPETDIAPRRERFEQPYPTWEHAPDGSTLSQ